ncbi:MAG: hypothetical protein Q9169_007964 [Polycauliona sp. 2 TL-2023]
MVRHTSISDHRLGIFEFRKLPSIPNGIPTMLPEAIRACYDRYKAYESAILGWVVSVSNTCGYVKVPKPGKRLSITFGSTPHATPESKNYIVPRDEILPRVEQIVNCTKPQVQVPPYIINYLRKSIADRERCNSWFQDHYAGDVSIGGVGESTDNHIHFTELLKSMLSMLDMIAVEPSNLSQAGGLPRSKSLSDLRRESNEKPRYMDLRISGHVEDLVTTEEEASDSSDGSTTAVSEDKPVLQTAIDKCPVAESTEHADDTFTIYDLVQKLRHIRDYVEDVWTDYRERHISLIHATLVTNAAIDCVQDLEFNLGTTLPKSADWGDLVNLYFPEVTAHWQKDQSTLSSENIKDMDMVLLAPTMQLKLFLDVFEDDGNWSMAWLQTWLPEINKIYDYRLDNSKLSWHERLNRTIVFLDSIMPDLVLYIKPGDMSTKDRVITGFKDLLGSNPEHLLELTNADFDIYVETRRLRLWVVFAFAVLCDTHLVLGDDISRPFKDIRQHLERARTENRDYVENTENVLMDGMRRELNEHAIRSRDETVTEDIMMRIRKSPVLEPCRFPLHAQKPFFLFSHHPLLCGSEAISFGLSWQRHAMHIADMWWHTSAALHLYSALKQEGCLPMPLPFLDGLQALYGIEKVFLGNPPTGLQAYKNQYLLILGCSIQYFAANKRKGAHTQSAKSENKRIRDLRNMCPLVQFLEKDYNSSKDKRLPQLTKLKEMVQHYHSSRRQGTSQVKPQPQCDDVVSEPIHFLTALSEWLEEEQPRLDFDYYRAHNICWRLLRRIETSPRVQKKFRETYHSTASTVDQDLKHLPLFIFSQQLDDPKGQWMQSVGETVTKFFLEIPAETLEPISIPQDLEDPTAIRFAKGYRMSENIYHPEKNKKCYHVGVCALQAVHWRLQTGLDPWEEGDADGAWWQGLRADLTEEKRAKATATRHETHAPAIHAITAEEILRLISPEGLGILEMVTHFKDRLCKTQLKDFSTLLYSVAEYNHDTKIFTPLSTHEKSGSITKRNGTPTQAPLSPFTITAADVLAVIPPEGLGIMELVTHFRDRLYESQIPQFNTLLQSITHYNRDTKRFTFLLTEANAALIVKQKPRSPLTVTAAEIQAVIPPAGLGIFDLVRHFSDRLQGDQMRDFDRLLMSVAEYDEDTELYMRLN